MLSLEDTNASGVACDVPHFIQGLILQRRRARHETFRQGGIYIGTQPWNE